MISITLLVGTGSPMPSPDRGGPATLISAGNGDEAEHYLVDADRGAAQLFRNRRSSLPALPAACDR